MKISLTRKNATNYPPVVHGCTLLRRNPQGGWNILPRGKALNAAALLTFLAILCVVSSRSVAEDHRPGDTFRDCADCPEMVVIPPGHFLMGSSEADTERELATVDPPPSGFSLSKMLGFTNKGQATTAMASEHPQHLVTIHGDFAIGKYPVTTGEFATFVNETEYETSHCTISGHMREPNWGKAWQHPGFTPTDRDPVVCVSWEDAKAYIRWLNKKVGGNATQGDVGPYRLPSEAEWEYAARAGTETARWWGNTIGVGNAKCDGCEDLTDKRRPEIINGQVVWPTCCGPQYERRTATVGSFPANPFGLYDMLGNAWQDVEDCWHASYEGAPSDAQPWEAGGNCGRRVSRGGGWNTYPWTVRSATRANGPESLSGSSDGFRLAKTLK